MEHCSKKIGQLDSRDYHLFVGLDVDKASIAVTVRDREGLGRSLKMPYDAQELLSFIHNNYPSKAVTFAYEAGPTGFGLYDVLTTAGHKCLVVSPGSVPTAPNDRVKTNRLDSKRLAELLCGAQLRGIRVPGKQIRELRSLVHLRYTYMQDMRSYKWRIKAELLKEGLSFPRAPKGSQWSGAVIAGLRRMECCAVTRFKLESMLDHLEQLSEQMHLAEVALRSHIRSTHPRKVGEGAIVAVARKLAGRMHCVLKEQRRYEVHAA